MNDFARPEFQNSRHEPSTSMMVGTTSSRRPQPEVYPDELLFRHARASSAEPRPSYNTGSRQEPDFNNNYIAPQDSMITSRQTEQRNLTETTNQSQGPVSHEITRLRVQLDASHRAFQSERRKLLARIDELEQDLETINSQRQEHDYGYNQLMKELESKNQHLSDELTRTLLKNVQLVEENADLKNVQRSLSTRMSALEDQLQRLDTPSQENIKAVLKKLEKREASLKNQARRLAQLESYYTRELNLLTLSSGRSGVPELQGQESSDIQIIHPQPAQPSYSMRQQQPPTYTFHPVNPPRLSQVPVGAASYSPMYQAQSPPGRNSYSEMYYKTITDKAINLIQREAVNCKTLLQKYAKPNSASTIEVSSSDQDIEAYLTQAKGKGTPASKPPSPTPSNEEEEMLKLLFFKF